MDVTAEGLGGWWIAWITTGAVIAVVALVAIAITASARRIAALATDATRSLETTRDSTEVLWKVATTNRVTNHLLEGAASLRAALGGDVGRELGTQRGYHTPEDIVGGGVDTARDAVEDSLPTGPQIDPEQGGA